MTAAAVAAAALAAVGPLADTDQYKAGPMGLIVVLALCVASFFLFRSMTRHLKRVPKSFPAPDSPTDRADRPASPPAGGPPA